MASPTDTAGGGETGSEAGEDLLQGYCLTDQIGHILRRVSQRHSSIFAERMTAGLTPTRFAALVMLAEKGVLSQNELGRLTAMDIATIKGVVDRLVGKGLVAVNTDPKDGRRNLITLTRAGRDILLEAVPAGLRITEETLAPLDAEEQRLLIGLLRKIV